MHIPLKSKLKTRVSHEPKKPAIDRALAHGPSRHPLLSRGGFLFVFFFGEISPDGDYLCG
jgi:hypothetical protein